MQKICLEENQSENLVNQNIEHLKQIFPEVFSEGKVNFETLRQLLGDLDVLDEGEEKYGLNWHGKKKARQIALIPSLGTLLPSVDKSINWNNAQNIAIEGDNLEVLKLIQKSYANKIKMIYIDPPYNTEKDFIYPDNFVEGLDSYLSYTGQKEDDKWTVSNSGREKAGRKHTNWLSMMYPRLKLARSLLSSDGAIFISINEKEIANLRLICDEIFGEKNLLCQFSWRTDGNFDNQAKFKYCHEYILAYAKDESAFPHPATIDPNVPQDSKIFKPYIRNTIVKNGPKNPPSEVILPKGFPCAINEGKIQLRDNAWPYYLSESEISHGILVSEVRVYSGWSSKDLLEQYIQNNCQPILDSKGQETTFEITATGAIEAIKTRGEPSHVISTLSDLGGPQKATAEVEVTGAIFDDYPKPLKLIKYLLTMHNSKDFTVLDFFAGSGTTAHAVLELNKEDGGNRKFITVQLPQPTLKLDDAGKIINTEASKKGFETISEICTQRIRGAIQKIYGDQDEVGCKVFKLAQSNIQPWNPDPTDLEAALLESENHLIEGRTEQDILYELLLKRGIDLATPIEERKVGEKTIYSIGYGATFACLNEKILASDVESIAQVINDWYQELAPGNKPHIFFRDSAFENDVVKTNLAAILQQNGLDHVRSL